MFDPSFDPEITSRLSPPLRHGFENASIIIDQLRQNGSTATADALYAFVKQELHSLARK